MFKALFSLLLKLSGELNNVWIYGPPRSVVILLIFMVVFPYEEGALPAE